MPVWGIATVVCSKREEVKEGERIYGYFPSSGYELLRGVQVVKERFIVVSRPQLPPDRVVYNTYHREQADPFWKKDSEDHMILLRPVWITGYWISDMLNINNFYNSQAVVMASASSKTALSTAASIRSTNPSNSPKLIGLTSSKNKSYLSSLNLFDEIFAYEEVSAHLPSYKSGGVVYIDYAGNASITKAVIEAVGSEGLKRGILVGMSHWDPASSASSLSSSLSSSSSLPQIEFFFAPAWIQKRTKELGAEAEKRQIEAWWSTLKSVDKWYTIRRVAGADNVKSVYQKLLNGQVGPQEAYLASCW